MADDAATRTTLGDLRDGQLHAQHFIRGSVQSKFHLERKDGEDTLRFYLREESTAGTAHANVFLTGRYASVMAPFLKRNDHVVLSNCACVVEGLDGEPELSLGLQHGSVISVFHDSLQSGLTITPSNLPNVTAPKRKADAVATAAGAAAAGGGKRAKTSSAGAGKPNVDKVYTPVGEVGQFRGNGKQIHLYGVVSWFKPVYKSRGSDYACQVTVRDPTWTDSTTDGLKCMLFHKKPDMLPQVKQVGDVIRLHRLKINTFNGQLQALSSTGFSALTFDGRVGAVPKPRDPPHNFSWSGQDERLLHELRAWAEKIPGLGTDAALRQVDELTEPCVADVLCQVVHLNPLESNCIITVCDATPPHGALPRFDVNYIPEGSPFPRVAFENSLRITAWDKLGEKAAGLRVGDHVRLLGVEVRESASGPWKVTVRKDIVVYSDPSEDCLTALRTRLEDVLDPGLDSIDPDPQHDDQAAGPGPYQGPAAGSAAAAQAAQPPAPAARAPSAPPRALAAVAPGTYCTVTAHEAQPVTTIGGILQSAPTRKFHVRARCLALMPEDARNICKAYCPGCKKSYASHHLIKSDDPTHANGGYECPECTVSQTVVIRHPLEFVYNFALRMTDGTGELDAIVYGPDAVEFFGPGLPPTDLYLSNVTLNAIKDRLDRLLNRELWMDCCVKSYTHIDDRSRTMYRVFGTTAK